MVLVGYGVCLKGKPSGLWPVTLSAAQRRARYMIDEGMGTDISNKIKAKKEDVTIVPIYTGNPIELAPAAPVFAEPVKA